MDEDSPSHRDLAACNHWSPPPRHRSVTSIVARSRLPAGALTGETCRCPRDYFRAKTNPCTPSTTTSSSRP
ncbi:hypothetical protein ACFPRL_10165 [Pseudoclavibacter helvolus]